MTSPDAFFDELRREYLTEAPARLAELKKDLAATKAREPDAAKSLKNRLHKLAGSGGSYGFPDISSQSRTAERWLMEHPAPDDAGLVELERMVAGVAACFDRAAVELGLPAAPSPRAAFAWHAVVIAPPGVLADRIAEILTDGGYAVNRLAPETVPAQISVSERADLAVLADPDGVPLARAVGSWTGSGGSRPTAVVLVCDPATIDPLAVPHAHLDHIVDRARLDSDLARFARGLGHAKTAPRTIVLAATDQTTIGLVGAALESTSIALVSCSSSAELRSAFDRTPPDLLLTTWEFPKTTGVAIVRWVRHLESHKATPIIVLAKGLADTDRISAERAGADVILAPTVPKDELAQILIARIERGLEARARYHRDDLTGLSTQPALAGELDHAIAQARRTKESVSYLAIDLDHFRRVNEEFGVGAGDGVLIQAARIIGSTVRAGDLVARVGGEEIGVMLRRCDGENAMKLAEKLRAQVAANPTSLGASKISIKISVGVATFPDHAASAADLVRTADRALKRAKDGGRDRVEAGG